jgi:hypothetical protein
VVVGTDPLDRPQGAGSEARAGAVGDAEIHRHPDQRDLELRERRLPVVTAPRRVEQRRDARVGGGAPITLEDGVGDPLEDGVADVAALALGVARAQAVQPFVACHGPPSAAFPAGYSILEPTRF